MMKEFDNNSILNDEHLVHVSGGYHGVYSYSKGDAFRKGNNAFLVTEDCPYGEKVRVTACTYWDKNLWIGSTLDDYLPNDYFESAGFAYIGNNVLRFR